MTLGEVVELAAHTARHEGWQLGEPLDVVRQRRSLLGPIEWEVLANGPLEGSHRWVRIDDRSGDVIASGWRLNR